MSFLAFVLVAQVAAAGQPSPPVLTFPEKGLDDSVAYAGYSTRFFRDATKNTLQIYLDRREGRTVHLLANGENESIGFSARRTDNTPADLQWDGTDARVWRRARTSYLSYELQSRDAEVHLGRFVLGSMRIERDVQYFKEHTRAFSEAPYALAEFVALTATLARQSPTVQRAALTALGARSLAALEQRVMLRMVDVRVTGPSAGATIEQLSLDGRDTLRLTVTPLSGTTLASADARHWVLRASSDTPLRMRVTISSTGRTLSPLTRAEIFTDDFLAWARDVQQHGDATRARWIERQITGVELLSSREKLMAGLPTYATYFGRDMLVSALMMQPIWRPEMSEFVLAAALRKLSASGEVSHEEALGGQALRESAAEAVALLRRTDSVPAVRADSLRRAAIARLRAGRATRENYHMVDDEYQLPIMAARYLDDPRVSAERKRRWLLGREGAQTRRSLLLSVLAVVADRSAPYAANPVTANFVAFAPRDATADAFDGAPRWFSQSWRDSGAGYANGKFAMDVNGVYIPHALQATQRIVRALRTLGVVSVTETARMPALQRSATLSRYVRDSATLTAAIRTWQGALGEFVVRLTPTEVQARVAARVRALPDADRTYWRAFPPSGDGIEFLAVALDAAGERIGVANSDPATRIFLDGLMETARVSGRGRAALLRDVSLFARDYPEGLLVPAVGAVVANDAYAAPAVWKAFADDAYHGPRVVWGREVNLFLLGVASHLPLMTQDAAGAELLRNAALRVRDAVSASGFRSELWSYEFPNGRPQAVRYGSGGDVQLWSTTDLAVQYVWARLPQ
ncbi:hypothetical protein [Gemmatimonas sp.]|uniref:hypothetical protein n=1 Tax=Gemmatimonas sp. TaxID=1962908 RepID=UPI0037BFF8B1